MLRAITGSTAMPCGTGYYGGRVDVIRAFALEGWLVDKLEQSVEALAERI